MPHIQTLILQQDLVDLSGLLTQLEGVSQTHVVGLELVGFVVHSHHFFLGLLEGIGHGGQSGHQVIHTALEVLILHLEPGELVCRVGGAVRDETLDDFLYAVAVLEGVDDGKLLFFWQTFGKLERERGGHIKNWWWWWGEENLNLVRDSYHLDISPGGQKDRHIETQKRSVL